MVDIDRTKPDRMPGRPEPNRLAEETSAYLRQHMYNPVNWHPWGAAALSLAAETDKPLLVSIGYSACHWCHVMERESFEDPETAALMNSLYVPIKVDREERPDVDQIYMDTVVRLTGHGGWPLTCFCTPEGRPFYAGTYFPPDRRGDLPSFREVLTAAEDAYRKRRGDVEKTASQILAALAQRPRGVAQEPPGRHNLVEAANQLMLSADHENGGFGGAPKFPTPTNLEMLLASLDVLDTGQANEVLAHCAFTCREMARRGLYDHLGGAFHRYCVDGHWGIPHFEKMLYDQGLLLRVYVETWRRSGCNDAELAWPIEETAEYLRREMTDPEGGFYASQDADSEGVEGKYFVWEPEQVRSALGDAADAFCDAYGVTQQGNFEGGTTHLIDRARKPRGEFARDRTTLHSLRDQRVAPGTDRKRVAAWNGYAISGLARAGSLLGDPIMLSDAARAADFVLTRLVDERGRLQRVYNEGRAHVSAFLDDHASLLDAYLDLYRAGAGERFLEAALLCADQICQRFFDTGEGDLFLTPDDGERLVHRPRSDHDGATPNASGLATLGLLRMGHLAGRRDFLRVAENVIRKHAFALERAPHAYPTLLRAVGLAARGPGVAIIVGDPESDPARALADAARRTLSLEDAVVVVPPDGPHPKGIDPDWLRGREARDGRATAYLCRGTTCSLPIHDASALADPENLAVLRDATPPEDT